MLRVRRLHKRGWTSASGRDGIEFAGGFRDFSGAVLLLLLWLLVQLPPGTARVAAEPAELVGAESSAVTDEFMYASGTPWMRGAQPRAEHATGRVVPERVVRVRGTTLGLPRSNPMPAPAVERLSTAVNLSDAVHPDRWHGPPFSI